MTADRAPGRTRWVPVLWPVEKPALPAFSRGEMAWVLSRVADVEAVLRSGAFSSPDAAAEIRAVAARVGLEPAALIWALDSLMLIQNGPSHRASRDAVTRLMRQVMLRWTRERLHAVARRFARDLEAGEAVDVVPGLVDALPNAVAGEMLGLSTRDVVWLRDCAQKTMTAWRPGVPLREYVKLEPVAAEAKAFLEASSRGSPLAGVDFFLLAAAVVTTSGTLGAAIYVLAQHADLQQTLRGRPERMTAFLEEVLRLGSAVRRLGRRVAGAAFKVGDVVIPAEASVILDIERAGRDPAAYQEPETLDLERNGRSAFAFGGGNHPCMGPRLAHLEMAAAIGELLARFELRPAGEPEFAGNRDLRFFKSLRIGLLPRSR